MTFEALRFQEETVQLSLVPGKWIASTEITSPPPLTSSLILNLSLADQPVPYIESSNALMAHVLPPAAMPQFSVRGKGYLLNAPLKCSSSPYSDFSFSGLRSGKRSCIVKCKMSNDNPIAWDQDGNPLTPDEDGTILLRLKGCGNWTDDDRVPFPSASILPYATNPGSPPMYVLRGFCHPISAANELFVIRTISPLLTHFGIQHVDTPLGFWSYANLSDDPAPLEPKACAIMQTTSDKRGEHHFLIGYELFLHANMSDESAATFLSRAQSLYQSRHVDLPSDNNCAYKRVTSLRVVGLGKEIRQMRGRDTPVEVDLVSDDTMERNGFLREHLLFPLFSVIMVGPYSLSLIAQVVYQFAWECGKSLAGIHRNGFLWGTFFTRWTMQLTSDAHVDNIIVLPRHTIETAHSLVAPTDFDLSFHMDSTFNLYIDPPTPDPGLVQHGFESELLELMGDVAGNIAETGGSSMHPQPRHTVFRTKRTVLWVMRELMAIALLNGYLRPMDPLPFETDVNHYRQAAALVDDFLVLSHHIHS